MKSSLPRVLVVDDDPNFRKTLADILRVKGFKVVVAASGAEGVAEAARAFVSVALIDLKLPDMSGIEVMESVKHDTPLTEAIILTGNAALETAIEATNKGAFSYLLKPYDINNLLLHIRHAVDRQLGQQEIIRLASFPALNPAPVFELDASGEVTYLNPAASIHFPDLISLGMRHPILEGLQTLFSANLKGETQDTMVREVGIGAAIYEQRIYSLPESERIRIYALDVTERKEREARIERLNARLQVLREINENLLTVDSEQRLFRFACDSLRKLDCIVIAWGVLREPQPKIMPVAWAGVDEAEVSTLQVRWDDAEQGVGFIGSAIRQRKAAVIDDAEADDDAQLAAWQQLVRKWGIRSAIAIPIHATDETIATLSIFSRRPAAFDAAFVEFLYEVSRNIAIGVHSLRADGKLHATLKSLRKSLDGTVEAIARMVALRDPYTAGHQRRVAQLAYAIGQEMELPERQTEGLRVTGYLHDIGKIALPAEILSKPIPLTGVEFAIVKAHARAGYDILKDLEFPWPVAQAVLQHHERLDGSGYPQGLKGTDIILEARILMVADVVEAMASARPYREAHGLAAAIDEITLNQGRFYDADVVSACLRLFAEHKFSYS